MVKEKEPSFGERLLAELNLAQKCRQYHLPLWQCPQLLFVVLGGITVGTLLWFYFTLSGEFDPYTIALIATALASFLVIQMFIIVHAFERLAEASRMQVEFMNIASHQLRGPVTAAKWALKLVTDDGTKKKLSAQAEESIQIIDDAVERMGEIVSSILRIARVEAGRTIVRAEEFPINDVVAEVVRSRRWHARAIHIDIVAQLPDEALIVRADREEVHFSLERLLDNALRYSRPPAKVVVSVERSAGMAQVRVQDSGEGIPLEEQKHVFKKFFRASNASTLAPGGNGLSLYIVRSIIEASGGRIGFQSSPHQGSTFWFTLPLSQGRSA